MSYELALGTFAAARAPEVVAALLVLAVAARRWRDDRAAAALLIAGGVALGLHVAAEVPLFLRSWPKGDATEPLWERLLGRYLTGNFRDGWSAYWLVAVLPAVAAACGFAAVFLRPDPAADRTPRPPAVD